MRSTAQLRALWAPPCRPRLVKVAFASGTTVSVDARCQDAFKALAAVMAVWGYRVNLRTPSGEICTGAYLCRPITGGTGYSLHAYGVAVDVNSDANPYGPKLITNMPRSMVEAILATRTNAGLEVFRWGGNYRGNKDCLGGDTELVTEHGPVPIRELAGQKVMLLTTTEDPRSGKIRTEWFKAPVECYGPAKTYEVVLRRRGARVSINATANHRWPVLSKTTGPRFVETSALRAGYRLPALEYPPMEAVALDETAIARGIVWGDGSLYNCHGKRTPRSSVQLCGAKSELRPWIEPHAGYWTEGTHGPHAWRLASWLKSVPAQDCSLSEAAGFFAGWFACDGFVSPASSLSLSSSDPQAVAWLIANAARLGLTISSVRTQSAGKSGFCSTKDNRQINFRTVDHRLLLRDDHRRSHPSDDRLWTAWTVVSVSTTGKYEETFCPTVKGRNVCALSTGGVPVLTGQSMHYEVVASPAELAAGIDWRTVASNTVARPPITPPEATIMFACDGFVPVLPPQRGSNGRYAFWAWRRDGSIFAFNGAPGPIPSSRDQATIVAGGPVREVFSDFRGGYVVVAGEPDNAAGWSTYASADMST